MSNKVRNVTKQLLGAEDVAFGRGIVQQNRGGTLVPVHKLDIDLPVADESELALTNVAKYPKASIGSRLFVGINGQYQELSRILPVIFRVGGAISEEYPYCENGNVIAKWTGAFPKTLTLADADFSTAGWEIYTVGSGRTIVSETAPPSTYGEQGIRWYNPVLPATFIYYVDSNSGQWVEENHAGILSSPLNAYVDEVPPPSPDIGTRWYNPSVPATFVFFAGPNSSQWVEEASQASDGLLRTDLATKLLEIKGTLVPFNFAPYTFANLPLASANPGAFVSVTDRAFKPAYSNGSSWLYVSNDNVVS